VPSIDIHTVGAGGGSIAWIDPAGVLRVGPASAGADPGPACYGTGEDLTVTDANLLLGRLDPDRFLGGRMRLDAARARAAASALARRAGLAVDDLLEGVLRVANAGMERAIRVVSMQRGHDPRRFALVAFGGAGGMHACDVAGELSIGTILVPRQAGVLSALGMLLADATRDYSASVLRPSRTLAPAHLERAFAPLVRRAMADLTREGIARSDRQIDRQLDVRYVGQSYEITVPWSPPFQRDFHREHRRLYGYADEERPTEVVAVRVRAIGRVHPPARPYRTPRRRSVPRPAGFRPARFGGRLRRTALHRWDDLEPGARGRGPAIVTSGDASVVVTPGYHFRIDGFGNVVIAKER